MTSIAGQTGTDTGPGGAAAVSLIMNCGKVYSIPTDCIFHDRGEAQTVTMTQFANHMSGWTNNILSIDSFLSANHVGNRGYSEDKIVIVKTEYGFVWASRLSVLLTTEEQIRLGIEDNQIGFSFLWPWYPSKASHAFEGVSEKTINDGIFRELTAYEPTREVIHSHILSPAIIDGATHVPLSELTAGQRAFAFMIAPGRSWSTPRYANDDYKDRVKRHIDRKQSMAPHRQSDKTSAELIYDREFKRVDDLRIDWDAENVILDHILERQKLSRKTFPKVAPLLQLSDKGNLSKRPRLHPGVHLSSVVDMEVDCDFTEGEIVVYEHLDVFDALPADVTQLVCLMVVQDAWTSSNPLEGMATLCAFRSTSKKIRQHTDEHLFQVFSNSLNEGLLQNAEQIPHCSRIEASHLNFSIGAPLAKSLFGGSLSADICIRFQQIRVMISYMQSRSNIIKSKHLRECPDEQTRRLLTFLQRKPFKPIRIDNAARSRRFHTNSVMSKVIDDSVITSSNEEITQLISYIHTLNPHASSAKYNYADKTSWVPESIFAMEDSGPMSDAAIA
tara:strand:- start:448 stop:2121 length:1674 start_codon:yes stop_codon:yes gene_type:complete